MPDVPEYKIKGGIHAADFVGRDQTKISFGFSAEDVDRLLDKVLALIQSGGVFLPPPDQPDALRMDQDGESLTFQPGAIHHLSAQGSLRAYLLSLVVDQEYQRWATRFVPLEGKMELRQVIEGLSMTFTERIAPVAEGGQPTLRTLNSIAEALNTHPAFVILGEPGAGKSTTQQKIAYDTALAYLEGKPARLPLFVRLSQQKEKSPYEFLQTEWEQHAKASFKEVLDSGSLLILADGINEIAYAQRADCLKDWMVFQQDHRGANQLIFSGRKNDYDNELNLPQVWVEPLDDARIADFLERHQATALQDLLDDPTTRLRELAVNPLNLFVLVQVFLRCGKDLKYLANRGSLFKEFALLLLEHEQRVHPDGLLVSAKIDLFATLAYQMQKQGTGTVFLLDAACQAIPATVQVRDRKIAVDAESLFRFGRGASVLDPATLPDVRFYHHLLQEYFAARELLRRFEAGEDLSAFWQAPRLSAEMPAAEVGKWDQLPDPPGKGWEVTTLLACGLARDPSKLIAAVRQQNPTLAGRCVVEAGVTVADAEKEATADRLLQELYDPAVHLRARLKAGSTLGWVGDPRFKPQIVNGVKVILPQVVAVPAGRYPIGSQKQDAHAQRDEQPQHPVDLPAFSIGKWPVTHAEFACFMHAGGYTDPRWWQTALARRWLSGEEVGGGQLQAYMDVWKQLQAMSDVRQTLEQSGNFTPDQIDVYENIAQMTEGQLKEAVSSSLAEKSRREPAYWQDTQYNNPSQPVVGITWFEACAYCAWLAALTGQAYRLPSEVEWEAAARGKHASLLQGGELRTYPWQGAWDAAKANTMEGRVLQPSPVGAYAAAGGTGPFGAEDQAGNIWEWTSSLYLDYPYSAEKSEQPESEDRRVLRGGSWFNSEIIARCAFRNWDDPDAFYDYDGFRVVVAPPLRSVL